MSEFFRRVFGRRRISEVRADEPLLPPEELERIGTEEDLLSNYETASERNFRAMEAEQGGDLTTAIALYEESVSEEFVGVHPYERLANIYERQGRIDDALRVRETFVRLAKSGRLPKGAQRSAERKLPDFEAKIEALRDGKAL